MKRFAISCLCLLLGTLAVWAEGPNDRESDSGAGSAKSVARTKILKISSQIDKLVEDKLFEHDEKRNALCDDETFLRRVYLDVTGRIPTLAETRMFLDTKNRNKRADLIDQLLDSYGHVSHEFNFWADLLRIKSRHQNVIGQPYIDFMKDALESNKPYDELVRELVTSEGPMLSRENGSVGYYLRDRNMPEDNMSNTIRVFLGTRLECAQCHDHPFDDWTQRQYYEMVAFTGGLMTRLNRPDSENAEELMSLRRRAGDINEQLRANVRRLIEPMTYGVSGSGTGLARLPENYLGSDGEDFDIVQAKTMFEGKKLVSPEIPRRAKFQKVNSRRPQQINGAVAIDSRQAYGDWMTDPENPRFAKVMANRIWKRVMGLGLIEPVDDLNKHTVASNPELMDYLTRTFVELDFDMKQFRRAILNSKTYQAVAYGEDVPDPNKYYFNGPIVRRMSAEQIWDSLLTLTIPDVDIRKGSSESYRNLGRDIYTTYEYLRTLGGDEIIELAKQGRNGKGLQSMMSMQGMNEQSELKRLGKQKESLNNRIKQAKKNKNKAQLERLMKEKDELIAKYRRTGKGGDQLNRASEIRSPASPGHFLREFGQSDRETIQNANSDPAVTQALSLMNGMLENRIVNNNSTELMKNLLNVKTNDEAVEVVYLTMLNRKPSRRETTIWSSDLRKMEKQEIVRDLIWTLANTNEFMFIK